MMYTRSVSLLLGIMLAAALLVACTLPPPVTTGDSVASPPTARPTERTLSSSIQADEMLWETSGGGQVTFSVRRNDSGFDVHVTSYGYDDHDDRFAITPDAGEVYSALVRVMQDQRRIRRHKPLPGETTGTWTKLQFSDGEHTTTVEDVMVWAEGDAKVIYDFVTAQIEAGGQ
jgi:hypothetical protein